MIRYLLDKVRLTSAVVSVSKQISFIPKRFAAQIVKSEKSNENLIKDVIVYSYENPRMFQMLNLFSISQLFFWGYIGNWAYSEMKDVEVSNRIYHFKLESLFS